MNHRTGTTHQAHPLTRLQSSDRDAVYREISRPRRRRPTEAEMKPLLELVTTVNETATPQSAAVENALKALTPFGPLNEETTLILLGCWSGRSSLSASDVAAVVALVTAEVAA